jgi:hypothetical protein
MMIRIMNGAHPIIEIEMSRKEVRDVIKLVIYLILLYTGTIAASGFFHP